MATVILSVPGGVLPKVALWKLSKNLWICSCSKYVKVPVLEILRVLLLSVACVTSTTIDVYPPCDLHPSYVHAYNRASRLKIIRKGAVGSILRVRDGVKVETDIVHRFRAKAYKRAWSKRASRLKIIRKRAVGSVRSGTERSKS
jgi:hypothetical protein